MLKAIAKQILYLVLLVKSIIQVVFSSFTERRSELRTIEVSESIETQFPTLSTRKQMTENLVYSVGALTGQRT